MKIAVVKKIITGLKNVVASSKIIAGNNLKVQGNTSIYGGIKKIISYK
jgi:hypothetical protein